MKELRSELKAISEALQRLAGRYAPGLDAGVLDRHRAFRAVSRDGSLLLSGIGHPDRVNLRELRGIDHVLAGLKENTEQFLAGLPCNNVLLYGPRGTGKSSAVKALLNAYWRRGLKMVEVPRDGLLHILEIAALVRSRPERFIAFCDDLTFEHDETSYRQIKTILEGGLEARPDNMLIYATSNRRHLMPEMAADNLPEMVDGELQPGETVEERMSLSDRFGLRLGLHHFDMETYLDIVANYASLRKLRIAARELSEQAARWSIDHGSFSGRTARQFIDDLEGRMKAREARRYSRRLS